MRHSNKALVRDIMMGAPVTLGPDDNLSLAQDVIFLGRIRHIPVVEDGKLVGLISERDLLGRAATRLFNLRQKNQSDLLKKLAVKEIMKKRVITVAPDTSVAAAAKLMADKKIGCVPVVSGGTLVGLLTTTDLLRYLGAMP